MIRSKEKDDWDKLSGGERYKVEQLAGKDWENVRVFCHAKDIRERAHYNKCQYGSIEILLTRNGKPYRVVISAQISGKQNRKRLIKES